MYSDLFSRFNVALKAMSGDAARNNIFSSDDDSDLQCRMFGIKSGCNN